MDEVNERFSGESMKDPVFREKTINHLLMYFMDGCTTGYPSESGATRS
jgi:hypothetical protein